MRTNKMGEDTRVRERAGCFRCKAGGLDGIAYIAATLLFLGRWCEARRVTFTSSLRLTGWSSGSAAPDGRRYNRKQTSYRNASNTYQPLVIRAPPNRRSASVCDSEERRRTCFIHAVCNPQPTDKYVLTSRAKSKLNSEKSADQAAVYSTCVG